MQEYIDRRPVVRFLVIVLGLTLLAGVVVALAGLILGWSSNVKYSDGFFFACVFFAAVGTVRSMLYGRNVRAAKKQLEPPEADDPGWNRFERILAHTSLDFKLILTGMICLAVSILIAQM